MLLGGSLNRMHSHRSSALTKSYGLKKAYLLQDIVAWRQSVWDRYHLTAEEKGYVKVSHTWQIS